MLYLLATSPFFSLEAEASEAEEELAEAGCLHSDADIRAQNRFC